MGKIVVFLILLCAFLISPQLFTAEVQAVHKTKPSLSFTLVRLDTKQVEITINNPDDDFTDFTGTKFVYQLEIPSAGGRGSPCTAALSEPLEPFKANNITFVSSSQIKVSIAKIFDDSWSGWDCGGVGPKRVIFGVAEKIQSYKDYGRYTKYNTIYLDEFGFSVEQVGGGFPKIAPTKPLFGANDKVQGLLSNAKVGNTYVFWWNDQTEFDATYTPQSGGGTPDIINTLIDLKRIDKPQAKLCMDIFIAGKNPGKAIGLACRDGLSAFFNFTNTSPPKQLGCKVLPEPAESDKPISLVITDSDPNGMHQSQLQKEGEPYAIITDNKTSDGWGNVHLQIATSLPEGNYQAIGKDSSGRTICQKAFVVGAPSPGGGISPPAKICILNDPSCTTAQALPCDPDKPSIKTAIGCIHTNPGDLIQDVLKFAIGIGGGLAFLMMLLGAFQMLTSAGNPETLAAGKDRLTSAIIGLLFVIFSVLLLQIIGVDILGILKR